MRAELLRKTHRTPTCRNRDLKTVVEWFRNGHEHRNDILRFGFMRLHRQLEIRFIERPLAECVQAGFPRAVAEHQHRHTSVFAVSSGTARKTVLVDSEDSFFWMSPLVHACDLTFVAAYSSRFFEARKFVRPYQWQTDSELSFYQARSEDLWRDHGSAFHRVRRYVPIAPNLSQPRNLSWIRQRIWNLRHRIYGALSNRIDWAAQQDEFEERYNSLIALRSKPRRHDIVLLDSLWGWPRHRIALHTQLSELSARYDVHARLNWAPPVPCDASDQQTLDKAHFPQSTGMIEDYEHMLAGSRLGVFATGFHWGWRNIMTLALFLGLPVLTDRLVIEPWFSMKAFHLIENEAFGLAGVDKVLHQFPDDILPRVKRHNQSVYDAVMSPEAVARYVLDTANAG